MMTMDDKLEDIMDGDIASIGLTNVNNNVNGLGEIVQFLINVIFFFIVCFSFICSIDGIFLLFGVWIWSI